MNCDRPSPVLAALRDGFSVRWELGHLPRLPLVLSKVLDNERSHAGMPNNRFRVVWMEKRLSR